MRGDGLTDLPPYQRDGERCGFSCDSVGHCERRFLRLAVANDSFSERSEGWGDSRKSKRRRNAIVRRQIVLDSETIILGERLSHLRCSRSYDEPETFPSSTTPILSNSC